MGTNQKHTPGPWSTDPEGHIRAPYPNHAPGISIARMTCFGAHDVHMAMGANAALISAAPDLLAALEAHDAYMLATGFSGPDESSLHPRAAANWRNVRAAIAKAKGEA